MSSTVRDLVLAGKMDEAREQVWGQVLAITGSIGSGKSLATRLLGEIGYRCLSADAVTHSLLLPGAAGFEGVVSRFGPKVLDDQGKIDRKALGQIVFSDPALRHELEAILHPLVVQASAQQFVDWVVAGEQRLAYEIPLLFEAGQQKRGFRAILFVMAAKNVRIARVMARDGVTEEDVRRRMAAQWSDSDKAELSDFVVWNEGTEEELRSCLAEVVQDLESL